MNNTKKLAYTFCLIITLTPSFSSALSMQQIKSKIRTYFEEVKNNRVTIGVFATGATVGALIVALLKTKSPSKNTLLPMETYQDCFDKIIALNLKLISDVDNTELRLLCRHYAKYYPEAKMNANAALKACRGEILLEAVQHPSCSFKDTFVKAFPECNLDDLTQCKKHLFNTSAGAIENFILNQLFTRQQHLIMYCHYAKLHSLTDEPSSTFISYENYIKTTELFAQGLPLLCFEELPESYFRLVFDMVLLPYKQIFQFAECLSDDEKKNVDAFRKQASQLIPLIYQKVKAI